MNLVKEAAERWSAPQSGDVRSELRIAWLEPLLANLRGGRLRIVLPNERAIASPEVDGGLQASLAINRWRALRRVALGGAVAFAEAYVDGDWTSSDLVSLLRLAARNQEALCETTRGSSLVRLANRIRHLLRANTRRGSRRNIMAHYDLGNAFYALWLDQTMLYSSALWREGAETLEAAQEAKLDRIVDLLALEGGESVLEIGCGWGALAMRLAETKASNVTAITLSPAQLEFARARAAVRHREGSVDFRLQDYRDVDGQFDRIVSIEMLEAVGEARWPSYFRKIATALKRGGRAVLQVITIDERHVDAYRRDPDFIQKHIFPGGFLPSKTALRVEIERAGLRLVERESFGASYALTLAEWRRRFHARWPDAAALGFDERFRRLWDYYLAYCQAGFAERTIDVSLLAIAHA
jgi:cyclopropane-fatty-acyl-phospholipid synthase